MNRILHLLTKYVPFYKNILLILLAALFSAHYILVHHSKYSFFKVVKVRGYLPSLLFSFLITVAIIYAIYRTTIYLNQYLPYSQNKLKRTALQVTIGIFGVSILAIAMVFLYFTIFGQPERIYLYWHSDFPLVFTFIVIVNAFIALLYFTKENAQLLSQLLMFRQNQHTKSKQKVSFSEASTNNDYSDNNIAYITKSQRRYMVVYLNGNKFIWSKTISETINFLPSENFFRINQRTIVNREIIQGFSQLSSRRLQLHGKPPFVDTKLEKIFVVSQNLVPIFLKWLENEIEQT